MTSLLIMVVSFNFVPKFVHHSYLIFINEVIYFQINLTIIAMATHNQQEIQLQRSFNKTERNDGREGSERISWAVRPLMDQQPSSTHDPGHSSDARICSSIKLSTATLCRMLLAH
jgi:hypothetical protein